MQESQESDSQVDRGDMKREPSLDLSPGYRNEEKAACRAATTGLLLPSGRREPQAAR
jgi:hypothetical protein